MSKPKVVITFRRPTIGAALDQPCLHCEEGFIVPDPDSGVAIRCAECGGAAETAAALRRARLPAGAYEAAVAGVGDGLAMPPKLPPTDRKAWKLTQARLTEAVICAMALEKNQHPPAMRILAGIMGGTGTGKTWMLTATIAAAVMRGVGGLYVGIGDPFEALGALGAGEINAGLRMAQGAPVLALDDVGGHREEKRSGMVRDLIAYRADRFMVTLIATRLSFMDLRAEMGESVADQVQAACVQLTHGSLRGGV